MVISVVKVEVWFHTIILEGNEADITIKSKFLDLRIAHLQNTVRLYVVSESPLGDIYFYICLRILNALIKCNCDTLASLRLH